MVTWSSKNLIVWNWLKKFMQVDIDVTCMYTNFGGRVLFGFGDFTSCCCSKAQNIVKHSPLSLSLSVDLIFVPFNCLQMACIIIVLRIFIKQARIYFSKPPICSSDRNSVDNSYCGTLTNKKQVLP